MRKKTICIGVLWLLGIFIIPGIITFEHIVSIQIEGPNDAKGDMHEEIVGHKFVCLYGGYPRRYPENSYCDKKEFISNLSRYEFQYTILVMIFTIISGFAIFIVVLPIQVYKAHAEHKSKLIKK